MVNINVGIIVGQTRPLELHELAPYPERGGLFRLFVDIGRTYGINFFFGKAALSGKLNAQIHVDYKFGGYGKLIYGIQFETINVNPLNYFFRTKASDKYKRIYTWDFDCIKAKSSLAQLITIPYTYPNFIWWNQDLPRSIKYSLIASNRNFNLPALSFENGYLCRQKFIHEFDLNSKNSQLYLYGNGWDRINAPAFFHLAFRRLNIPRYPFKNVIYFGAVDSKFEILKKSIFNICVENKLYTENYITEKIYDSLSCGAIPIYLGTKTLDAIIPKSCYIDLRDFTSIDKAIDFCESLSVEELGSYRNSIKDFLIKFDWATISEVGFVHNICKQLYHDICDVRY